MTFFYRKVPNTDFVHWIDRMTRRKWPFRRGRWCATFCCRGALRTALCSSCDRMTSRCFVASHRCLTSTSPRRSSNPNPTNSSCDSAPKRPSEKDETCDTSGRNSIRQWCRCGGDCCTSSVPQPEWPFNVNERHASRQYRTCQSLQYSEILDKSFFFHFCVSICIFRCGTYLLAPGQASNY